MYSSLPVLLLLCLSFLIVQVCGLPTASSESSSVESTTSASASSHLSTSHSTSSHSATPTTSEPATTQSTSKSTIHTTTTTTTTTTTGTTSEPATSTSATSTPSALPTASTKTIKSKRGIAYPLDNNPDDVRNFNQTESLVGWVYDWSNESPDYLKSTGLEIIPMQWGSGNIENFAESVKQQGAKTALIFNEPDFTQQSNIAPVEAASLWKRYIDPMKADGIRLGGPAITNAGTGQPWLQQFMAECADCNIDFLCVHWYGSGTAGFYDFVYQIHGQWPDKKIWVTEYADTSLNVSDVAAFMNETTAFMDSTDWIERYAWFGYFRPDESYAYNFLGDDGGLNALGEKYIGANTVVRSGAAKNEPSAGGGEGYATVTVATTGTRPTLSPSDAALPSSLKGCSVLLAGLSIIISFLLSVVSL